MKMNEMNKCDVKKNEKIDAVMMTIQTVPSMIGENFLD